MRISHIGVRETRALFSSTSLRIYNKEKCEKVKEIIFNKFAMDSDTFLFNITKTKIGPKFRVRTYLQVLA